MLHGGRLLPVEHVHHDAGRVAAGRGAGVVAAVRRQRPRNQQSAGPGLLFGDHADAPALGVIDDVAPAVPVNEAWRVGGLEDDAGQVDVAAALDVQLGVSHDFRLRYCQTKHALRAGRQIGENRIQ